MQSGRESAHLRQYFGSQQPKKSTSRLRAVKTHHPYNSSKEYMETYKSLLHQEAFGILRDGIKKWLNGETIEERVFRVLFKGFKVERGKVEVEFQTKREAQFKSGTLFCISPTGNFQDKVWATVSERDTTVSEGDTKRYQISLQIVSQSKADNILKLAKSSCSAVMIESKQSFIATGPVLRSFTKFKMESFPLQNEIVFCRNSGHPPQYLSSPQDPFERDALKQPLSSLDKSQWEALKHTLSSRLSIIQGPPGCGKTYMGKAIVKCLLEQDQEPTLPILVLSYKNHSLDEFLKGVIQDFLPKNKVVRVGGESKEPILDACNLKKLRPTSPNSDSPLKRVIAEKEILINDLKSQLKTLRESTRLTWVDVLRNLSEEQLDSWLRGFSSGPADLDKIKRVKFKCQGLRNCLLQSMDHLETVDMDMQHVAKLFHNTCMAWVPKGLIERTNDLCDGEMKMGQDGDRQDKRENTDYKEEQDSPYILSFGDLPQNFSTDPTLKNYKQNLWNLSPKKRRLFLSTILAQKESEITHSLSQNSFNLLEELLEKEAELKGEQDVDILKSKKLVGMTITGASVHSALVQALRPSIVIVEEAGEVLEPHLLTALTPGLQHLILIGDHQQLRPIVQKDLLKFKFDVSMMERLINNKFPHRTLAFQSRMRPEFSKLMTDIYPKLQDNMEKVSKNEPLECITHSMFFWDHSTNETHDGSSHTNNEEMLRVTQLAMFLLLSGVQSTDITVLAAYKSQVTLIRNEFDRLTQLNPQLFLSWDEHRTNTIDAFQGDENKYIIISLVRSNLEGKIGFLRERNRRCVAQSRAKCGMYFVGDSKTLSSSKESPWTVLIQGMAERGCIGRRIPLQCSRDNDKEIKAVKDGKQLEEVVRSMCVSWKPDGHEAADQTSRPDQPPGSLSRKTLEKPLARPYGDGLDWLFQRKDEEPPRKQPKTKDSLLSPGKIRKLNSRRKK